MSALYQVVIPSTGRESLERLLRALARGRGPRPGAIFVVDDRRARSTPLLADLPRALEGLVTTIPGRAAGPAAARNVGWRAARSEWVAFLDDDVVPSDDWPSALADDLVGLTPEVGASQGIIEVPLPLDRRPTDWERNVAGLEGARYATADMAYRRAALAELGGFDERFPRAYREDADLALRALRAGYRIERGRRRIAHPVGPADPLKSVRLQAGNADDVLMAALHAPGWRELAGAPPGRRRVHLLTTAAGLAGLAGTALRRSSLALAGAAGWLALTLQFAGARLAPGPRTLEEVATVMATSALIPVAATYHWLRGWARLPNLLRSPGPRAVGERATEQAGWEVVGRLGWGP